MDDITDALDQAVFKVRDQFLRGAVIPKLAASRVERCVLLSDVAQTLGRRRLGGACGGPPDVAPCRVVGGRGARPRGKCAPVSDGDGVHPRP